MATSVRQESLYRFNLVFGDGNSGAADSYKSHYTGNA